MRHTSMTTVPPTKASTRDDSGRKRTRSQIRKAQAIIDRVLGFDK